MAIDEAHKKNITLEGTGGSNGFFSFSGIGSSRIELGIVVSSFIAMRMAFTSARS
jgi:hypothetical protein